MKKNSLNNRLLKKIEKNKIKYFIICILMIFSTALFVAFIQSYGYMVKELEKIEITKNVEDINFETFTPVNNLEDIEEDYNVHIEKRKTKDIKLNYDSSVRMLSITDDIDKLIIKDGEIPKNKNEVILNSNYAKEKDININDDFEVGDNVYKVIGFGITPDYYNMLKSETDLLVNFEDFGLVYTLPETFDNLDSYEEEYLMTSSEENIKELKDEINQKYILKGWTKKENNPRINLVSSSITSSYKMGVSISILLMFISSFVISIIISREIKSECTIIGTLMSLGYRKGELISHYLKGTVILSIISALIGYAAGCVFAGPLIEIQNSSYEIPNFSVKFNLGVLILEFAILLLIVILVNYVTLSRIINKSPLFLLRNELKVNKFICKRINFEKCGFINIFRIKLAVSNMFKMIILFISIALASVLVFAGFGLKDSVNTFVKQYDSAIKYNHAYILNNYYSDFSNYGECEESLIQNLIYKNDKTISVQGIKDDSTFFNIKFDGNSDEIQVVISSSISRKFDLKKGDTIKLYNEVEDEEIEWKIDDIVDWTSSDSIFIPIKAFWKEFDLAEDTYNIVYSVDELDIDENMLLSENNKKEMIKSTEIYQNTMEIMNYIILSVSICMAIAIIYIVMIMIVEENTNNISLMKVMGYREKELKKLFLNINHIVVPVALIVGRLMAGLVINASLVEQNYTLNGYVISTLNNSSTVISCLIIVITYLLTNIILNNKLRKVELIEVIKNRE